MGRFISSLVVLLLALGCSGGNVCVTPEFGCADVSPPGVATPIATPDFAVYQDSVNGVHELLANGLTQSCATAGCHNAGGVRIYQLDAAAAQDSQEMQDSHQSLIDQFTCFGERNADDIAGAFVDRLFPGPHQGLTLSAPQLQTIRDWAATGEFPSYAGCP